MGDKGFYTFPTGVSPKLDFIVAIQYVNHYVMETQRRPHV